MQTQITTDYEIQQINENSFNNKKLTYTIPEVAELLNISIAHTYKLANKNILPTIRLGKRILVSAKRLEEFINR